MIRLKELRKENSLTQKQLAQKLLLTQASLSDWEIGKVQPSIEVLIKLADFFEVSIDFLVGRSDELDNVNVITNGAELSADEKTLLQCFDKLSVFERESILIQVKALAGKRESETIKK